jgi:RHS repeat-associated protein
MSVEGAVTTYYAWAGRQIIAEYEASGTNALVWKMSYVYMNGRLLATEQVEGIRYHHLGQLGTRLVTDASDGAVVSEQLTMPFGTQIPYGSTLGGDNSWQHPGRSNLSKKKFTSYDRSDATGLDYAVNRFYSSQQGRFTQVDPIGMSAASLGNPQTLNLYAYCGNDPINNVDPDGLFWGGLWKALKAIGKAIANFFSAKIGGYSPGFRTPPIFPGSLPSTISVSSGGNVNFRTPPFVSGFLHTSSIAIGGAGVGVVGMFLQMLFGAISAAQKLTGQMSKRQKATLESGLKAAEKRLDNKACADLFGGKENALATLKGATIKYDDLGVAQLTPKKEGGFTLKRTDASWNRESKIMRINTGGAFESGGTVNAINTDNGTRVTAPAFTIPGVNKVYEIEGEDDLRAFILLHELGHATEDVIRFERDCRDFATDEARRNNDRLYEACFK